MRFKKQIGVLLIIAVTYSMMEILRRQNQFRTEFEPYRLYINIGVILGVGVIYIIVKSTIRKQFDIPFQNHVKRFKWYDKMTFIIVMLMLKDFLEYYAILLNKLAFNMNSNSVSKNQHIANEDLKHNPLWYSIFDGSVTAPIIEEIMFRGLFYLLIFSLFVQWNKGRKKLLVYIMFLVISSTYFGYRHVAVAKDYQYILPYIASGVAFTLTFVITKSILYSASVHAISNLFVTLQNAQTHGVSNISSDISVIISMSLWFYIIIYSIVKVIKHLKKINEKLNVLGNMKYVDFKKIVNRYIEKL